MQLQVVIIIQVRAMKTHFSAASKLYSKNIYSLNVVSLVPKCNVFSDDNSDNGGNENENINNK